MEKKQKRASASVVRKALTAFRKEWNRSPAELISLLKKNGSSKKGSSYERELCHRLSAWWTNGEREDIFWRTAGSGARAKVRGRSSKTTAGQHGDIAATDPIGKPLIDAFTIELKRGYSENTIQDLLDCKIKSGVQPYGGFIAQTIESYEQANSFSWMLVTRRNRRRDMVWLPYPAFASLRKVGAFAAGRPTPFLRMQVSVRYCSRSDGRITICGCTLDDFLSNVQPFHICQLVET